jgi:hypothetical protein
MSDSTPINRRDLEARIVGRAQQDEAFRQELLRSPTETILKELGLEHTPAGLNFQVLEETPEKLYLVLPLSRERISELAGHERPITDRELQRARRTTRVVIMKCEDE